MNQLYSMVFGPTPEELVKKWKQNIRQQQRDLDKNVRQIETEELKTTKLIKQSAKRNDMKSCQTLAKGLVQSRKQKERLMTSKAQLNSLSMHLEQQLSVIKVTGVLEKSTQAMKTVNQLVKLPQLSQQMTELSKEMMKAGMIQEMVQDVLEEDDIEEEADEEVDKILQEVTGGLLQEALPVGKELEVPDEIEERLQALKN
ncbi:Snf7 family [Gorgonomyces haynaldii]|nr:Snf7 family [Gorgonomyces haynaldii]